MTYKDFARALEALGMRHSSQKQCHHRWVNPSSGASVVLADEGDSNLSIGIINESLATLNISVTELEEASR